MQKATASATCSFFCCGLLHGHYTVHTFPETSVEKQRTERERPISSASCLVCFWLEKELLQLFPACVFQFYTSKVHSTHYALCPLSSAREEPRFSRSSSLIQVLFGSSLTRVRVSCLLPGLSRVLSSLCALGISFILSSCVASTFGITVETVLS